MEDLKHWRAKRAGGRITIYGKGPDGQDRRVPHVDTIEASSPYPVAVDKDGARYRLLPV